MNVSVTASDTKVTLAAPYDDALPARARRLGGAFDRPTKTWTFDIRDEQRVRDLARDIYGTDGSDADEPRVTVRVVLSGIVPDRHQPSVKVAGHEIAHRPRRDEAVRLANGVVIVEGEFTSSGGSMRNPALGDVRGVVIEVRDLPQGTAERAIAQHPRHVTLADPGQLDVAALRAERDRLTARLAEISKLLGE